MVFISGQIAVDPKGKIVGRGNVVKQYEWILRQIDAIMRDAGGDVENVVKLVHYVAVDVSSSRYLNESYPKISRLRKRFFRRTFPVSTMIGVTSLMQRGALIEVDALAIIPK